MKALAAFVAACALSASLATIAQRDTGAQKDGPSPPAKIAAMAWLKGYWVGEGFGGTVEDLWGPPKAGVMIGSFRHTKADGTNGFYEIVAIEEVEGTLRLVVKHFHTNWVGWEEKGHALQAKLVKITPDEAVFGNMSLKRVGKDQLVIEMRIMNREGVARTEVLRYKRKAL